MAAQKKALAAAIEARGLQAALDGPALLQALQAPAETLVHRPVALQGRWLGAGSEVDSRRWSGTTCPT